MAIKDSFLAELGEEAARTRRYLERLPEEKLGWRPHEKSMTLGRLATHIAELPSLGSVILTQREFDMAPPDGEARPAASLAAVSRILALHDENIRGLRQGLESMSDEGFMEMWTLKKGGQEVFSAPRVGVMRFTVFNHVVHHRAQLSVYLRLNDIPLPFSYGPSADEEM